MAQSGEEKITQHISRNWYGFTVQHFGLSLYLASKNEASRGMAHEDKKTVGSLRAGWESTNSCAHMKQVQFLRETVKVTAQC